MVTKAPKNDVKIKQMGKPLSTYPSYFQNIIHCFSSRFYSSSSIKNEKIRNAVFSALCLMRPSSMQKISSSMIFAP